MMSPSCAFRASPSAVGYEAIGFAVYSTGRSASTKSPERLRAGYLKKFNAHQQGLKSLCDTLGILHHLLPTDQPLEGALHAYLADRQSLGQRITRSRST